MFLIALHVLRHNSITDSHAQSSTYIRIHTIKDCSPEIYTLTVTNIHISVMGPTLPGVEGSTNPCIWSGRGLSGPSPGRFWSHLTIYIYSQRTSAQRASHGNTLVSRPGTLYSLVRILKKALIVVTKRYLQPCKITPENYPTTAP
jgi:hypothetical protein